MKPLKVDINNIKLKDMIVELNSVLQSLKGSFNSDYYIRELNGKLILQKKPFRGNHKPTQKQIENQQRFIRDYAKRK